MNTSGVSDPVLAVVISLAALVAVSALQLALRVGGRRDGVPTGVVPAPPPPRALVWEDAAFWGDWTSNIILALGILLIKDSTSGAPSALDGKRIGVLLACLLVGLSVLPSYVRWFGIDQATGHLKKGEGIFVSNLIALFIIVTAVAAGVSLY